MRMNRSSLLTALGVASALSLLAAACGGDDGDDTVSDTTPTTAASPTTAAPADSPSGADGSGDGDGDGASGETDDGADSGSSSGDDAGQRSDGGDDGGEDPAEPDEPMVLTASWRGVTEDSITLGVSMLNFEELTSLGLSKAGWGDQEGVFQALVDDVNSKGGVNGRMIVPVYDYYSALSAEDAIRSCTKLTQDNEVFAVLLGFVGPSGTEDPCIVGTNETVLVGGEATASELARADELAPSGRRAPWYTVEPSVEAQTNNLIDLLVATGRDDGARVFVVSHPSAKDDEAPVLAYLADSGFDVVGNAVLDADDADHPAQNAIMEVISERIRSDGANSVLINGNPTAVLRGLDLTGLLSDLNVWTNNAAGLNNLGASIDNQSIARGVLASEGPSEAELWNDVLMQECVEVVRAALPEADIKSPDLISEDEENWFNPIRRYCGHLKLFVVIAEAAGGDLTPQTFADAANSLDDFALPGLPANSLFPGKQGARDLFRLSGYDPDFGDGGLVPVTDLIDIYP